uniref:Apolipoprotein B mRNA editing enzyme catalytic polypeptide-like 4 n=1 Tax=Nannospalax galili TaxID=1026970 RepID=A0A8C6REH8_NANGA
MELLYEEYLTHSGTIVKPYYWLSFSLDCTNCPYHIRTGEEARVPYTEFQQIFGFPCNCTGSPTHLESMLFEINGYLDSTISNNSSIRHITLYSNNSPCNEANHCCISKIYKFLMMYPDITLSIFFAQLYHTHLASLQPQVTLSPISGGIWHSILENFVSGVSGSTVFQPVLAGRALTDRYNAYEINSITRVKPYFIDALQTQPKEKQSIDTQAAFENYPSNNTVPGQSSQGTNPSTPVVFALMPYRHLPLLHVDQNPYKPRNVVRHLNMPQLSSYKTKELGKPPMGRPVETVETTERSASSKEADKKNKKKWTK